MRVYNALPLVLLLAALPAEGTTTYYCDAACGANTEAAFSTAFGALITAGLTSSGTVNFTGETPVLATLSDAGPTEVDFTGFNGVNPDNLTVVGSQLRHSTSGSGAGILIALPAGVLALGTHVTQASGSRAWCFETATGVCNLGSFILASGTTSFIGVISDAPLPSYQFRGGSGSGVLAVADFSVASMAETPEGPTYLMLGLGLIIFPVLKYQQRARALRAAQSLRCSP